MRELAQKARRMIRVPSRLFLFQSATLALTCLIFLVIYFIPRTGPAPKTIDFLEDPPSSETIEGVEIDSIIEYESPNITAEFPKTKNDSVNKEIKSFAEKLISDFKESIDPTSVSELYLAFNTTSFNDDIVSFKFTYYANSTDYYYAEEDIFTLTFNLSDAEKYSLEHIFISENDTHLETLSTKAFEGLKDHEAHKENQETLKTFLEPSAPFFSRFTVDEEKITFHFAPYELGANEEGAPETFSMTFEDLDEALIEPFKPVKPEPIIEVPATSSYSLPPSPSVRPAPIVESSGPKYIALTFDDGPHCSLTPSLLNILAAHGAKATFFILGSRASYCPGVIQRAHSEGHQIASHTQNHKQLTSLSLESLQFEINATMDIIAGTVGARPTSMRPPYGSFNNTVRAYAGSALIIWSVDPEDWRYRNAATVSSHVQNRVRDGSIILLHDIHASTVDAATTIIPALQARGYIFLTIDELITLRYGGLPAPGQVYYSAYP